MPNPICRFPQLFSAKPETAIDLERFHRAVAAAVKFDNAGVRGISECREGHNLLQIIQKEILRDAALVAFSQAVQALEKEHKQVIVQQLCAERDQRVAQVEHFRTEVMAMRSACEVAVNDCFRQENEKSRALQEQLNAYQRTARDKHAIAVAFAEETGRQPSLGGDGDASHMAAQIAAVEETYRKERQALMDERDAQVATLKRTCETTAKPLWSQYTDGYQQAQAAFIEALDLSKLALRAEIAAKQERLENDLASACTEIDELYKPFYEAAQALQAANQALVEQMKTLRTEGSARLASSISGLFDPAED